MKESRYETADSRLSDVGVVAIGRNEGERLTHCLNSALRDAPCVIYVDSGSRDGSPSAAEALGASVHELDLSVPFTAARARNAGFAKLLAIAPEIQFVQFVDGDCEISPEWLATARSHLATNDRTAAVFGRRRERHPDASVYNQLCDEEWNVPPGDAKSCGGDVMMRVSAFREAGGYRDTLIAGEEPELCVRLRGHGHTIVCLPVEMTLHDAAMLYFSQWWRRTVRSGHAYAEGAHLHGGPPEKHWVGETRRIWIWGFMIPGAVALSVFAFGPLGLSTALIYPAQVMRLSARHRASSHVPLTKAFLQVLGRFAEMTGAMRFYLGRLSGIDSGIIEYK